MQQLEASQSPSSCCADKIYAASKFFRQGDSKWLLKGLTYGPFAPNQAGQFLPERNRLISDFRQARSLGANCLRVYHMPTVELLDLAIEHELRLFVDIPWDKHRCFFEDWSALEEARKRVRTAARELGQHPGLFALSVANEIPSDIVRLYSHQRVGKFLNELIDIAKQEAPDCLTTFANYPSTEFLQPTACDFLCFNVYLNDGHSLGSYLDRLQHLAGSKPLILGEFGQDSIRSGENYQATAVAEHVSRVFHHGLAGSFVFSFTDDWYTGGHQIEDWAFGVTRTDRTEKPAAAALAKAWASAPRVQEIPTPKVSVVVCSYNGAATLRECLDSLTKLNYPDYEIILVDDGSRDNSQQIAAIFPTVRNIRQENKGLSVARNVGALAATGEIVAYTDSDCVVDADWLYYLVDAMQRQGVDAIGGPNVPPPSDCWTAQCVAASPGGPSHVMLDDQLAEHVPGCNMAFRRTLLLDLGGFDAQFRQAGDDVDICWRLLDAGYRIGYAASALVWHHRRTTVKAFLKQQKGYGRSEAMLLYKHPNRFNDRGCSRWRGVIYGEGAVGLSTSAPAVFHGRQGSGLFQTIYHQNKYTVWAYVTLLEWHLIAGMLLAMSYFMPMLAVLAGGMWLTTILAAVRTTLTGPLSKTAPWWCRPLVFGLHIAQPIIRAAHRYAYRLGRKALPVIEPDADPVLLKPISMSTQDAYWSSRRGRGREELLEAIQNQAVEANWRGRFDEQWESWDIKLLGDRWHNVVIYTATEQLGGPKRFTRARCTTEFTQFSRTVFWAMLMAAALSSFRWWPYGLMIGSALLGGLLFRLWLSRRRCFNAVAKLLGVAADRAGLDTFTGARERPARRTAAVEKTVPLSTIPATKTATTVASANHKDVGVV